MKKKALSLALALVMCLGLTAIQASALEGNNGSAPLVGLVLQEGATEVKDANGYIFQFSNPVNGEISNFEQEDVDGEVVTISDTYYLLPVGTVISIQGPDGAPAKFTGLSWPPSGAGEAFTEEYTSLTLDQEGPVQILSEGDALFIYGKAQPDEPEQPTDPEPTTPPAAEPAVASPTNDSLTADGVLQTPTVYKINGSNYFKIRDLAAILNGTEKQFSVGYDSELKSVTATTGEGYEKQEGDLAGAPAGGEKTAEPSNDAIYINGEKVEAEVYKIDGSNYFKLRDLGKALDFYVGYSQETGVFLETDKPYAE